MEIEIGPGSLLALLGLIVVVLYFVKPRKPKIPPTSVSPRKERSDEALKQEDTSNMTPMVIYFGSQTGTAEEFAKTLSREGKTHGFAAKIIDLEEFDPKVLKQESLALFVMATYGEGDPTDNAADFYKYIMDKEKDLEPDTFKGLSFCVFGLGNRQYEHYNRMGKITNKRLEELGATRVYKHGEGDDDGNLEEDFESWTTDLWSTLHAEFRADQADTAGSDPSGLPPLPDEEWHVVNVPAPQPLPVGYPVEKSTIPEYDIPKIDLSSRPYFTSQEAKVLVNRELRQAPRKGASTVHIEIDAKSLNTKYQTADNLGVLPENDPSIVNMLCKWLGYDPDQWIRIEPVGTDATVLKEQARRPIFPTPCTVREVFTRFCDLQCAPRKALLGYLAHFAEKDNERQALARMSSPVGKEEYHTFVIDAQRSVWEVFQAFPSVRPPLGRLLELLPRLQPRYYTIASSSLVHRDRIHVVVSVINTDKPGNEPGRELKGVCSNFMSGVLPPATMNGKRVDGVEGPSDPRLTLAKEQRQRGPWPSMRVFIRPSTFRLPTDASKPVILIGPGTGIAPMRAFLQERQYQRVKQNVKVGPTILFFGCRKHDEDFIYRDELMEYAKDGTLTQFHQAFSREQDRKVYVQHLLEREASNIWPMISDQSAHVYVCGATRMGHDVHTTLSQMAQSHGKMTSTEAETFLKQITQDGRYVQELWSA